MFVQELLSTILDLNFAAHRPCSRSTEDRQVSSSSPGLRAEQAARPTEERTDGAGLLVAEAAKGASHRLHSQASRLLSLLFTEDLLDPSRFSAGQAMRLHLSQTGWTQRTNAAMQMMLPNGGHWKKSGHLQCWSL